MSPRNGAKKKGKAGARKEKTAIVAEPSAAELQPTEEAKEELQRLLMWERRSEERDWVVGRPFK